jgi:hypothetical protein
MRHLGGTSVYRGGKVLMTQRPMPFFILPVTFAALADVCGMRERVHVWFGLALGAELLATGIRAVSAFPQFHTISKLKNR